MEILFVASSDALREPDPEYIREWQAVEELGIRWHVFNYDALVKEDFEKAFRFLKPGSGRVVLYRGWILKEKEYQQLEAELEKCGYRLFTSAASYARTCYLPNYYEHIRDLTVPAVWHEGTNFRKAWQTAQTLGPAPYIIKDYVKSAKELWDKACFLPEGTTEEQFCAACRSLKKYRGDRFERGIVIRPFIPLHFLETSVFGSHPIFEEYRLFFLNGHIHSATAYGYAGGIHSDFSAYEHLGKLIDSPFFTADIARKADGGLVLIELGDGGVSGLPPNMDRLDFYRKIATE